MQKTLRKALPAALALLAAGSAFALGTGRAAGTTMAAPSQKVDAKTCLMCHATIKHLRDGNAHKNVNCGSCHGVKPEHAKAPTAANRPTTRTDHEACAQCHKQELADMLNPKYHMAWAKSHPTPSYSWIRDDNNVPQITQYALPRFHISLAADYIVNRMGERFKYKNPNGESMPVKRLWDSIVDTRPQDGNVIKGTDSFPLKGHKQIGTAGKAFCLTCKSADNILDFAWAGVKHPNAATNGASNAMPTIKQFNSGFNCIFCHDPHAAKPRIIGDTLLDGMVNPDAKDNAYQKNVGKPGFPRVEAVEMGMRGFKRKIGILEKYDSNYMCGQCHLLPTRNSNFKDITTDKGVPGAKTTDMNRLRIKFPEGGALATADYFKAKNWYNAYDAKHDVKWYDRNHGHLEFVSQSKHGKAGVGCTDCHFAKIKGKFEHQPSLPKYKVMNTCGRSDCHGAGTKFNWKTEAQALYAIEAIQQRARVRIARQDTLGTELGDQIVAAREGKLKVSPETLAAMKNTYGRFRNVKSLWFTDYSLGIHNWELFDSDTDTVIKEMRKVIARAKDEAKAAKKAPTAMAANQATQPAAK